MKNKSEINRDIIAKMQTIGQDYPELSKYIGENPIKPMAKKEGITIGNLTDYSDSLDALLLGYGTHHKAEQAASESNEHSPK